MHMFSVLKTTIRFIFKREHTKLLIRFMSNNRKSTTNIVRSFNFTGTFLPFVDTLCVLPSYSTFLTIFEPNIQISNRICEQRDSSTIEILCLTFSVFSLSEQFDKRDEVSSVDKTNFQALCSNQSDIV